MATLLLDLSNYPKINFSVHDMMADRDGKIPVDNLMVVSGLKYYVMT